MAGPSGGLRARFRNGNSTHRCEGHFTNLKGRTMKHCLRGAVRSNLLKDTAQFIIWHALRRAARTAVQFREKAIRILICIADESWFGRPKSSSGYPADSVPGEKTLRRPMARNAKPKQIDDVGLPPPEHRSICRRADPFTAIFKCFGYIASRRGAVVLVSEPETATDGTRSRADQTHCRKQCQWAPSRPQYACTPSAGRRHTFGVQRMHHGSNGGVNVPDSVQRIGACSCERRGGSSFIGSSIAMTGA